MQLQLEYITDLYCLLDDLVEKPARPLRGRPAVLSDTEVITILLWNTMILRQHTLKDIYVWIGLYHRREFPKLPVYTKFVEHCHRIIPLLYLVLRYTLDTSAPVRFMDSTMVEVCKLVRADRHKVAVSIANFGKNHQGWHYGFKLHASINLKGKLCALLFTQASFHDAPAIPQLVNHYTKVAVGDSSYGASVMGRHINQIFGTAIIAPPHYKQKKKILTYWQHKLLTMRPKIECVFDYLKNHLHFVSSFPRSISGYVLHYLRILLGYQLLMA